MELYDEAVEQKKSKAPIIIGVCIVILVVITALIIYAIIYLKNNTIMSGTGQESDPFVVQENWEWFDSQYPSNLYTEK